MKKLLLSAVLFSLLLAPILANTQQPLVPCSGPDCTIESFFELLARIFNFIVFYMATPLAILMLTIGGILLMISAGNPNMAGLGRKILWVAAIGLVLVFCSWLIINFILTTLGYQGWNTL